MFIRAVVSDHTYVRLFPFTIHRRIEIGDPRPDRGRLAFRRRVHKRAKEGPIDLWLFDRCRTIEASRDYASRSLPADGGGGGGDTRVGTKEQPKAAKRAE